MKNKIVKILFPLMALLFLGSCANDELVPYYQQQEPGKLVIRGYNARRDSIQIAVDGKVIKIGKQDAFVKNIVKDYDFVIYENKPKNVVITNKRTKEILHSYQIGNEKDIDTISFYTKKDLWVDKVLSTKPGLLTSTGNAGFKFIFPTVNRYSASGYSGNLDGIIRKLSGETIAVAKNIGKDQYSSFVEFPASLPPVIKMELVKHGTTESYIAGKQVFVTMLMTKNKSRLIVLDEKKADNGQFSGIDATLNLVDFFSF
ncbi:hypothetical protein [Flavobacterium sp. MDT1-60]|uniref:hypothetical protein n=1 Tax=Flavobacterium sp. MDT1-60 TaxID=1979344 RepID=UPI00177CE7D0|nr:hypothetical protein [Flavobacterium sp. MDT1-60]QOG00693.1 hypothetical protein IHE43_12710 [Flavobacterium sp. MDT1-60]